jgi:surfeit locus 1 family protein
MFYHHYRFKPKLLPSLAVLVLFPFLLSLGFWQLGRMEEKQTIMDAMLLWQSEKPVEFKPDPAPENYNKIKVLGKFLVKFSVLLEHQMHNNQLGYQVLTPLEISADLPWFWVNRGWVPQEAIPKLGEPLEQSLELIGLIYYPSENRFILGENLSKTPSGMLKIQRMDFKALTEQFGHAFYPYVLLLDPSAPQGFVRDWEIKTLPPSKHLGYAVQWFALAGTLLSLYIIVNLKRKPKK